MDSQLLPISPTAAISNGGDGGKMARKGGWKSAIFIIFVEMAERFSYYGVAGNLITYLTTVLGQPTATAARNVNTFLGVSALFPILGAFLADSYVGRFKTIVVSTSVYILGLVMLVVATTAPLRRYGAFFFLALYTVSVGEGGHKPCVQTFAADQFDDDLPAEKEAKSSFFNWWYLGIVVGATLAILVVIYVEDFVGWTVGYGMLAAATVLALAVFLVGSRTYAREAPVGSPFTSVAHVVAAAVRKRRLSEERDGRGILYGDGESGGGSDREQLRTRALARTNQFRFLDKATIIDDTDACSEKRNPWRLCSVSQVEEVKLLLRLIPIWLSCLTFAAVIAQQGTFYTKQGATLDRSLGSFHFPPASFQVVTSITILVSVALYDRVLVPAARNLTGLPSGITVLQRIGAGLFFSTVTMVVAGVLETKRLRVAEENGLLDSPTATLPMTIWWIAPQYILTGLSDVFTIVGLQELFYDQMPVQMRSTGAALYLSVVGVGNFLSGVLITIVQGVTAKSGHQWLVNNLNRSHLNYFYWLLACLGAVNFCIYVYAAKAFVYKKMEVAAMEEAVKV
ncbi:PREDICTED: protein NRT1/ PTR FAMILY 5.4-like [Ipomoea nil]|uniref:protein NRT1/ PTR FAMILY 5.4-like n=1 Tax=Ipomoea nil TaxID=35883 RepID=UPI000901D41E|nr:PREDICTED: protein NRT1/ PTR FAMILY 5.4-like [Ipomoea nil]